MRSGTSCGQQWQARIEHLAPAHYRFKYIPLSAHLTIHMLGRSKSRARLGSWFVFAIVTATILPLALIRTRNFIF